jgi:hypothetical protein
VQITIKHASKQENIAQKLISAVKVNHISDIDVAKKSEGKVYYSILNQNQFKRKLIISVSMNGQFIASVLLKDRTHGSDC